MRNRSCEQLIRLTLLSLAVSPVVVGCTRPLPTAAGASAVQPATLNRQVSVPTIQHDEIYRRAVKLYGKGDRDGANTLVDDLLKRTDLTPSDREFLLRQQGILSNSDTRNGASRSASGAQRGNHTHQPLGDCGPRALAIILDSFGVKANPARLAKLAGTTAHGTSLEGLKKAATLCGLKAEGVQVNLEALRQLEKPAIVWVNGDHFAALLSVDGDNSTIHDPNKPEKETVRTEDLLRRSGGILLEISR